MKRKVGLLFLILTVALSVILNSFAFASTISSSSFNLMVDTDGGIKTLSKVNDSFATNYVRTDKPFFLGDVKTRFMIGSADYKYNVNAGPNYLSLRKDVSVSNFTYEADVTVKSGSESGLVFRVSNPGQNFTGYYVGLFASDNTVKLLKTDGTNWPIISSVPLTVGLGTSHHIKIITSGSSIIVYVDNMTTAKITATDTSYASGAVGLRTQNASASFDNVSVNGTFTDDFQGGTSSNWTNYNGGTWSVIVDNWQNADTRSSTRSISNTSSQVTVAYNNMGAGAFNLIETYTLGGTNGDTLTWNIAIKNNSSSNSITFGDIALPMPFNNNWDKDVTTTQTLRVIPHFSISANGSFMYVNRVNGTGPYLTITPNTGTSLEYFDNPSGNHNDLTTVYINSGATGPETPGTWRQPHTTRVLAASQTVNFTFTMKWATDFDGVRDIIYNNGGVDAQIVPGMTIPTDLHAKVALRSTKTLNSLVAEYPSETNIVDLGSNGAYRLFEIAFSHVGENKITVNYGSGEKTYLEFFVTHPLEELIKSRYSFLTNNQQVQNSAVWYDGLFSDWNMSNQTKTTPDHTQELELYATAGSDDPTGTKAPALAQKNALIPNQTEINALEYYAQHFVWGKLQRTNSETPYPYGIYGSDDWYVNRNSGTGYNNGGHGQERMWRSFDYAHMTLFWFSMYNIANKYPSMVHWNTASQYLDKAYQTAIAFFDVPYSIYMSGWDFTGYSDWAYKQGNFNELVIPNIIDSLNAAGLTTQANDLKSRWENKVKYMVYDHPYPFGSEMNYDTTAFESTHAVAKYGVDHVVPSDTNGFYDKNMYGPGAGGYRSHPGVNQADFVTFMSKEIAANKAARELIAPNYSQLGSDMRGPAYNLSYMTQMGGWGILDYAAYYSTTPEKDMRIGYQSLLAPFALINTGSDYPWWPSANNKGALAWAFETRKTGSEWPNFNNDRGPWKYDGENDAGIGGGVRSAETVLVNDPIFGLFAYGGNVVKNASNTVITPADGIRQRFHMLNTNPRTHMIIDRDAFNTITIQDDLSQVSFTLENRTLDAHTTNLSLQGLPNGNYDIMVNGVKQGAFVNAGGANSIPLTLSSAATSNIAIVKSAGTGSSYSNDFSAGTADWTTYNGTWAVTSGAYTVGSYAGAKSMVNSTAFSDFVYEADVSAGTTGDAGLLFRGTSPFADGNGLNGYYAGIDSGNSSVVLGKMTGSNWTQITTSAMSISANAWHHMKLVVSGSSIKVYVDDMTTPKINTTDATYTTGAIGVRTWNSSAKFDNILVKNLQYSNDFSSGAASGWTTYNGTWAVINGEYTVGSYAGAKSMVNSTSFSDFVYEADVSVGTTGDAGLIFRGSNPFADGNGLNGYYAGIDSGNGSVVLGKMSGSSWTQISTSAMTVSANTWHHVKIATSGSSIKVFVDDMTTPKINATDTTYTSGSIGVRTWNSAAKFDNSTVLPN